MNQRLLAWPLALLAAIVLAPAHANPPADSKSDSGAQVIGGLKRKGRLGVQFAQAAPNEPTIAGVVPGGSAAEAGVAAGDVVKAVNGQAVANLQEAFALIGGRAAGESLELTLSRGGEEVVATLTLHGAPMEEYDDFDVEYGSVESLGCGLRTIVTKPRGDASKKRPGLLFIPGHTCIPVELTALPYDAYIRLVEEMTRAGFVVMRVEKRGIGDSEGAPCPEADFQTEVEGYRRALAQLRERPDVDPDNLFVFGHSMGGLHGPILGAETKLKGIAAYGTGSYNWWEYMALNERRQMAISGASAADIDDAVRLSQKFSYWFYVEKLKPSEIVKRFPELADYAAANFQGDAMQGHAVEYWQQIYDYNLPRLWQEANTNSLVVWGTSDFVTSGEEHALIAEAVNAVAPGKGEYVALEGLDHLMHKAATPEIAMTQMGLNASELDERAVTTIVDWLKRVAGE